MNNLKDEENTNIGAINIIRNESYMLRSASRTPFISVGVGLLDAITPINRGRSEIVIDNKVVSSDGVLLSYDLNTYPGNNIFFREFNAETVKPEYQRLFVIDTSASTISSVDENFVNEERLKLLEQQFTRELIALIMDENFEYGIDTKADALVRSQMQINSLAAKDWLSDIFLKNFHNTSVLLGILRIITRLDYHEVSPEGQTMAMAALSHENVEIKECGVRAFESWGTIESLKILENLNVATQWLQEYIDEVVSDLRKEHNVHIR